MMSHITSYYIKRYSTVYKIPFLLFLLFAIPNTYAHDDHMHHDFSNLAEKKQTPQALYATAKQAYKMKTANSDSVYLVDVRTPAEVEFLGMPTVADVNIPYMLNDFSEWDEKKGRFQKTPNSNFSVVLDERLEEAGLGKDSTILLMCRSGTRSAKAAKLLHQLGYSKAYTVIDGYEGGKVKEGANKGQRLKDGWKNANLPWSYKLSEDKMYIE